MQKNLKDIKNKRIFRLYRRYREIERELKTKYPIHFFAFPKLYSVYAPIDKLDNFLKLRDEAIRIEFILYNHEYGRFLKYVKGGGTFFYTPMKKLERRKSLRRLPQELRVNSLEI